jgi:peptide chain release factor 3
VLWSTDDYDIDPVLAAVGQLQFEVVASRLQTEYGVETRYEPMGYEVARWVAGGWPVADTMKKGGLFNAELFKDGEVRRYGHSEGGVGEGWECGWAERRGLRGEG